jgi:hypothetical protein
VLVRALRYSQKVFGLLGALERLKEHRKKVQIPGGAFFKSMFLLFFCRFPSLNAMDEHRSQRALRRFLRGAMPCADQIGNFSETIDLDDLRALLRALYRRLERNKVLKAFHGHRLAVVDGHEINSSYTRCCSACQMRRTVVRGQTRIQYVHRAVIFQLAGPGFRLLLDFELLGPHEDEGTAALRLLQRVLATLPRCFDILLGDGLYPQARFFKLLRRHHKHVIAVLKDERRDLLKDARATFASQPALISRHGPLTCQCWDEAHFTSWESYPEGVRVVRALETILRRNAKGETMSVTKEWVWVTTLSSGEAPTSQVILFGHERWRIENEGFNELCNAWHADHYFHHHPVSITAFWLMLFVAHALFHCFLRNLKPARRLDHSRLHWANQIRADFLMGLWRFSSA